MIEQTIFDVLIGSVQNGEYSKIVGYTIIAVATFVRYITDGRFSLQTHKWISASSSLVLGIGAALAAGGHWWHALLLGAFSAPTSRGFWDLIRSLLPGREGNQ